jgi:hypothetical protein
MARVRFPKQIGVFVFASGIYPPFHLEGIACNGAKHEADHSPPSNAKVKNAWSLASTPPYVCMTRCLSTKTNLFFLLHDKILQCSMINPKLRCLLGGFIQCRQSISLKSEALMCKIKYTSDKGNFKHNYGVLVQGHTFLVYSLANSFPVLPHTVSHITHCQTYSSSFICLHYQ